MATTTKLISKEDFANYADISSYINSEYINRHILAAQDAYIKPILGAVLYADMQTEKEADTLTYANLDLLASLSPYLIYKATAEYLPQANLFSTNMGIRVYTEDNSRPANDKEIANLVKYAQNRADIYENELRRFLSDNAADYPDYEIENQPAQKIFPRIGKIGTKEKNVDRRMYL